MVTSDRVGDTLKGWWYVESLCCFGEDSYGANPAVS